MSKRLWALGLAMTLVALAKPGFGIVMHEGAKNDPAWQEEYKALGAQYSSVVAFYGYDGSSWWNIGSGTVISPHHVLGAAHVALNDSGGLYQRYGMVTGNHITYDAWGGYQTTEVVVNPLYTGIGSTDLAIWTFAEDLTSDPRVVPARLYTGSDTALLGSLGDFAGFGWFGFPSNELVNLDGAKRGCRNVVDQLGYAAFGYGTDQFVMSFDGPGSPQYQRLGGCGAAIDSGGGLFITGAPEPTLFAVDAWSARPVVYNLTPTGGTSVSQHIDWIYAVSGVPEPATAVLLALGVIFLRRRRG